MRFLILAHSGDSTAARVAARLLRRHSSEDVKLVSLNEITLAPRWAHKLDGARAESIIELNDGAAIRGDMIGIVFNRLRYVDMPRFAASSAADREYAVMEVFALLLSWLATLRCPVINTVSARGLGAPNYTWLAWRHLACKAGLTAPRVCLTSNPRRYMEPGLINYSGGLTNAGNVPAYLFEPTSARRATAFVAGENVFGDIPMEFIPPCLKLKSLSGVEIMNIHLAWSVSRSRWVFNHVDPCPDIMEEEKLDAVARLLEERS